MGLRRRAGDALARTLAAVPPASGAVVMGTAIVSIDLSLAGRETLSRILLAVAAAAWIGLALLLAGRAARNRARFDQEACSPAALTGVAGTAVLGTRLTLLGWDQAGAALLVIALGLWLGLLAPVLRHWVTPTVGVSFVRTVCTEALAVLGAVLAAREHADWLLDASAAAFVLGLVFYLFVLVRFDLRQLAVGHGDHWVVGGALAISTLAAGRIALGASGLGTLGRGTGPLEATTVTVWALAMLWLPALLLVEALRPRLRYDMRRWSTVFPVGMYASCSFLVGTVARAPAITDFARAWTWVAVAVWLIAFAAMAHRATALVRGDHPATSRQRIDEIAPSRRTPA